MAGINPDDAAIACVKKVLETGAKKKTEKNKFVILKINDERTKILVDGDENDPQDMANKPKDMNMYEWMISKLPKADGRYIYYRFEYYLQDASDPETEHQRDMIALITYIPDAKVKKVRGSSHGKGGGQFKFIYANCANGSVSTILVEPTRFELHNEAEISREQFVQKLQEQGAVSRVGKIVWFEGEDLDKDDE